MDPGPRPIVTSLQFHHGHKVIKDEQELYDHVSGLKEDIGKMATKDDFSKQTIELAHRQTAKC